MRRSLLTAGVMLVVFANGSARAASTCTVYAGPVPVSTDTTRCSFEAETDGTVTFGGTGKWRVYAPLPNLISFRVAAGTTHDELLGSAVAVGDFDGDGILDIAAGGPGGGGGGGVITAMLSEKGFPVRWEGPDPTARLGTTIAAGDIDGDGIDEVVATAPGRSAVVAFDGRTGEVRGGMALPAPGGSGRLTVATGDLDLDGDDDIAVGMPDVGGGAGAVVTTTGDGRMTVIDGAQGQRFGTAIAIADMDRDGRPDLVVGAPGDGDGIGAVYTVTNEGRDRLRIVPSAQTTGRGIGSSLAIGDLNGDGALDVVAGAPETSEGKGMVVAVDGVSHRFIWNAATDLGAGASAGASVAVADVSGDGIPDVVTGAPGATGTGKVLVISHHGRLLDDTDVPTDGARFGAAVALGDLNGDGRADVVVGAPGTDESDATGALLVDAGALHRLDTITRFFESGDRPTQGQFDVTRGTPVTLTAELSGGTSLTVAGATL